MTYAENTSVSVERSKLDLSKLQVFEEGEEIQIRDANNITIMSDCVHHHASKAIHEIVETFNKYKEENNKLYELLVELDIARDDDQDELNDYLKDWIPQALNLVRNKS